MTELRFLRLPEVSKKTGLSRSTIYERMKLGTFPKPINLGNRAIGFLESEVDEWIETRIADRNAKPTFICNMDGGKCGAGGYCEDCPAIKVNVPR